MKNQNFKIRIDILKTLEKINIDLHTDELEDLESFEDLEQYLEENDHLTEEIIYYSKAIRYLQEHDASLSESLELAHDLGYTTENLNSELLASLLASHYKRQDFYDIQDELIELFESLDLEE